MAFPWDTLITAVAVGGASLGGIWLKARYDDRAQERQARQASATTQADRQREAYAALIVAARLELQDFQQIRDDGSANRLRELAAAGDSGKADSLAADTSRVLATVEILGSDPARRQAVTLRQSATEVARWYRVELLRFSNPELAGLDQASFDVGAASALCHSLAEAIDKFIDTVRPEVGSMGSERPSARP